LFFNDFGVYTGQDHSKASAPVVLARQGSATGF
jgi:hypothetical protein